MISSGIPVQRHNMKENSRKLKSAINKQGEILHRKIDIFVDKLSSLIDEMDYKLLAALNEKDDDYTNSISEIKQSITDLKTILDSNDMNLVSTYQSKINMFERLPSILTMTLPTFSPREINKINIDEQFGSLSGLFIKTEEQGTILKSLGAGSSPPDKKTLIGAPRNIKIINITHMHGSQINIDSISCVSNNEFWISGDDNVMRLYNHQGHIVKSIQTRSGNIPKDTAVTRSGDLVYTDPKHFTVSIVKNTQIHDLIRLRNRKPLYVCCSSLGDFLVVIQDLTYKKLKVMRYSGSTEEQDTQFLFRFRENIVENKNFDICVADGQGKAIVVINHAGKLRYTRVVPK